MLGEPEGREQVHGRLHGLGVLQVSGDHADAVSRGGLDLVGDDGEGFSPGGFLQLAADPHIGLVQPLAA